MDIFDFIDLEINFHSEIRNPWYWRAICRIFGKKECHVVLVEELKRLKKISKMGES